MNSQWSSGPVLSTDGDYMVLNYGSNGYGQDATGSDFVTFPLDLSSLTSVTIEWWGFWTRVITPTLPPSTPFYQTMLFYGSDPNNYIWFSPSDISKDPASGAPYTSAIKMHDSTGKTDSVTLTTLASTGAWNHYALSFAANGTSYFLGSSLNQEFSTPFTFNSKLANIKATANPLVLVLGYHTPAVNSTFANSVPYGGGITNVRVWNRARTPAEIIATRFTSLSGTETGLIHQWKFSELTGTTVKDSVGNSDGTVSGTPQWLDAATFLTNYDYVPPPVSSLKRNSAYNGVTTINATSSYTQIGSATATLNIDSLPTSGYVCDASVSPCLRTTTTISPLKFNSFGYQFVADRSACGKIATFSTKVLGYGGQDPTTSLSHSIVVGSLDSLGLNVLPSPPTTGGNITFQATNLGVAGPLVSGESVQITTPLQGPFTCTNAEVVGNSLVCTVPPGIGGGGNVSITVCGRTYHYSGFGYAFPTIQTVAGSSDQLLMVGTNYGSSRAFDGVLDYVLINGQTCNVTSNNDTAILCATPFGLQNQVSYNFTVSIGGQLLSQNTVWQICFPGCLNGECRYIGGQPKCYCVGTSFKGDQCSEAVRCVPPCSNGGLCIVSADNIVETCNCTNGGNPGDGCAVTGNSNIGVIVPAVVVPVGVVLIVVGIVVAVFLARREKREGVNFIPLEKKDFTKIIYGDQLNQQPEKGSGNLKDLEALLVEDLKVAFAISSITQITEADKIAKAMIVIYQDNHKVLPLLEAFITEEVRTTESSGTLFRANSMVSKMFKFYSRLIGLPYLYVTIGPELGKIIEEEMGLEVDPEKMEEGKDLDEMRWALMSQSQKILKQVLSSEDKCPTQFRQLFIHIANQVKTRFPDNIYTTIGGFIFLRLFCPAVSSPEAYGIVEEPPSADARRLLILITKVLQNLSNDVEFGSKEPYMTKMNDFIHSNRLKLIAFYDKLLKPPTRPPVPCDMPKNIKPLNLSILASHIRDNLSKIEDAAIRSKLEAAVSN